MKALKLGRRVANIQIEYTARLVIGLDVHHSCSYGEFLGYPLFIKGL